MLPRDVRLALGRHFTPCITIAHVKVTELIDGNFWWDFGVTLDVVFPLLVKYP